MNGFIRDLDGGFSSVHFGTGGQLRVNPRLIIVPCGLVGQEPRGLNLGRHISLLVRSHLKIRQLPSELARLPGVAQGTIKSPLGNAEAMGGINSMPLT